MSRVVSLSLCAIALVATLGIRGAAAQPAEVVDDVRIAKAEAAFKKGVTAFDAGSLEKALAHYRESYALWPRARTLLNLALTLRKLGRAAEAANSFAQYLGDDAADEARVPAVKKALAELDAELGRLEIRALGEGDVTLDGAALAPSDLARPVRTSPGTHRVSQGDKEVEVEVAKGEEREVIVGEAPAPPPAAEPAAPAPPPAAPAPPREISSPRRWYLWTAVPTAVFGGAALGFALLHRSHQNELDDILADPTGHDYADAVSARDRADRSALYTNLNLGALGVGTIATVVLYVLHPKAAQTTVSASPGSFSLGWATAF